MRIDRALIGQRLQLYRQYLNMNQAFVSDYTGIRQTTISVIENGKAGGIDVILDLLRFYQKHYDLGNFFAEDFIPIPRGSDMDDKYGAKYRKRAELKQMSIEEKLDVLKSQLDEIIRTNKEL